jgi:hypothetical protein
MVGRVVPLAAALALVSAVANAQGTPAPPAGGAATAPAPQPSPPAAAPAVPVPAESGTRSEAELEASRKAVQDLEAQVIELRRALEAYDRSRASVDDIRRRLDEMDARLGENDRRDDALASGAGGEASLFKFRDDGFAMRSPNGRFYLAPHLRLQTVYTGALASQGAQDTTAPDASGFALTHAELILDGHVGSRLLTYRLQLDAAESPTINDAFIQATPLRAFGVRAGQFKLPYGYQRRTWSGELEFVDISAPTAAFALNRDIGLMVVGRPLAGRLAYDLAVTNGTGPVAANNNIDLAYTARIAAAPWGPLPPGEGDLEWHERPRLMFGLAGYYNLVPTDVVARTANPAANTDVDGDGRIDNVAVWQGGAETRAVWRGAALQAEWFGRYEIPGGMFASRSYQGAYLQGSYFVIRGRLQVAARIGATDVPRYGSTPGERALFGTHVDEQSGAVNWYLSGHRIKVQVDYTHSHATDKATGQDAGTAPIVHRVRAAVQAGF